MGCSVSTSGFSVEHDKELQDFLTAKDIELVKQSWSYVQEDFEEIGLRIFKRLFAREKHLKKLFMSKMMSESARALDGQTGSDVEFDEENVKAHGQIVMEALGAAVECLHDSDQLTMLLVGIGERHVMYGVKKEMVPLLWPAIVVTLEERLGAKFTSEIGRAWEHVFHYIGSKVIEGISHWTTAGVVTRNETIPIL